MTVDPRFYEIPNTRAVTPGEVWSFAITVTEEQSDGTFLNATDFASYAAWAMYFFEGLKNAGPTASDRVAKALISLSSGSGLTIGTAPAVTAECTAAQTPAVTAGLRAWELWATVSGKERRLRYGTIVVVS